MELCQSVGPYFTGVQTPLHRYLNWTLRKCLEQVFEEVCAAITPDTHRNEEPVYRLKAPTEKVRFTN
jgi:hypothetical protein